MQKASVSGYNPSQIEAKWRKVWAENKTFQVDLKKAKKPYYNLMMFPYPSAEGLHVGNMYAFTGSDIWGRYMRMKGFDVFEPIGLDGFGIHSENYALKVNKHPKQQAKISQENFYRQLASIGNMFSWDHCLETYDKDYYKWTQWIFIQLFKAGLAYRKKSAVNWCPGCKTVLADEQVINGLCERCESPVKDKELEQWFFKITDYADRLLENTQKIDWSQKVLTAQRNWIGKKQGINISYQVVNEAGNPIKVKTGSLHVVCFTTRPDTNFGATFVVLAPEHQLVDQIRSKDNKNQISSYVAQALRKSKQDRIAEGSSKTGVFTGSYALNQLTGQKMPIWVSDFVLTDFGTGAVVGVPGHDLRDFQFAQKFGLEIVRVMVGKDGDKSPITRGEQVQEEEGEMINSQFLDGMNIHQAAQKIMDYMEKKGWGKRMTTYHLRDWLISRQRYWGPPIPLVKCQKCGWVPVAEKDLPVILPDVKDWRPKGTGKSPLASVSDWVETKCPKCKGPAQRETDVSDTFLDSAWYFLRYLSLNSDTAEKNPWDAKITKKWLPVNRYIGGAEHSVLHLLYSRFLTMFFKDQGLLEFEEPFTQFRAHGLIIKNGVKMSKSKGNIVNPDKYIKKYGADVLRCYLMFIGPLSQGGDFRDTGMKGMSRFLAKAWRLCQEKLITKNGKLKINKEELRWQHQTIKRVTQSVERLKYNTALAAMMEYVNFLQSSKQVSQKSLAILVHLLAPFAPHFTEEIWSKMKGTKNTLSVHNQPWPKWEEKHLVQEKVEMVIQVNGRVRERLKVTAKEALDKEKVMALAKKSNRVQTYLKDQKISRVIFVSAKLINFVV